MPFQIYWKFYHQKMNIFSKKKNDIFHISAQNIDCAYRCSRRGFWLVFVCLPCVIKLKSLFNANSADPDQTSHYVSELGLHCFRCPCYGMQG